ncbi:hypothetical protein PspLS_11483, partial [Pyricularia sp. CBS 133598]
MVSVTSSAIQVRTVLPERLDKLLFSTSNAFAEQGEEPCKGKLGTIAHRIVDGLKRRLISVANLVQILSFLDGPQHAAFLGLWSPKRAAATNTATWISAGGSSEQCRVTICSQCGENCQQCQGSGKLKDTFCQRCNGWKFISRTNNED